jgi:hypothetical protein
LPKDIETRVQTIIRLAEFLIDLPHDLVRLKLSMTKTDVKKIVETNVRVMNAYDLA